MKHTLVYSVLLILTAFTLNACASATPTFQPLATYVLAPDTSLAVDPEILDIARSVVEERLNAIAPGSSRVTVEDQLNLKIELEPVANPDTLITVATSTGIIEFWDSPIPLETGLSVPASLAPVLNGLDISTARAEKDLTDETWQVIVEFTPAGAEKLAQFTNSATGHYLALSRDGRIVVSPRIEEPIIGGPVIIDGEFTQVEAKGLAVVMNAGALPVPLKLIESYHSI